MKLPVLILAILPYALPALASEKCNPMQKSILAIMKNYCDKCNADDLRFCGQPYSGEYKSTCEAYSSFRASCDDSLSQFSSFTASARANTCQKQAEGVVPSRGERVVVGSEVQGETGPTITYIVTTTLAGDESGGSEVRYAVTMNKANCTPSGKIRRL